jgi:hypothetical protein
VLGGAVLALFGVTLTSAAVAQESSAAGTSAAAIPALLVDGAFALAATASATLLEIPAERRADYAWLGLGAFVFVTAIGLGLVVRSSSLARAVAERAPVAAVVAETIGLSPDR